MFIGRENELATMRKLYDSNKFQMVIIYGRRRIGKTTLISKFVENLPAIFFTAQEANDRINLELFSKKVYGFFGIPLSTGAFASWNDAFDFIGEKAKNQRFVLALDEFPYAAGENRSLKSILQNSIDHELRDTGLFLILCGSHIGFMENEVLGHKSPLFGRRTAQIKLEGFNYIEASKFLKGYGNEDKIKFYSCIGGTPYYLSQIDQGMSFEENIKRLFFNISGYLYNEPSMLLQQELREPSMYNSIISAVAAGATRLNEIATKTGEQRSKIIKYLSTLINLRILTKEFPFGADMIHSRKGIYKILDNCFNFWYRFVFPNIPEIESGMGEIIAEKEIFPYLAQYIGKPSFEDICRQYLIRENLNGNLPFTATSFGNWWGNDPEKKQQADIDVIAANNKEKKILLCECKWRDNINDYEEIEDLLGKGHLMKDYHEKHFYFFSKTPFSKKSLQLARENKNLKLITLDMLFD